MFKNFKIGKKLLLGSVTIVLIFLAINSISFVSFKFFEKQSGLERHTYEVLIHIEHVLERLTDAETGQRGYILTGQVRYLEPYNRGIALVDAEIDDIEELTLDNPKQQQKIVGLRLLVADKTEELQETVDLRSQGDFDAAVAIVLSDRGKDIMDNIRDLLGEMSNEENRLLEIRRGEADESQTATELIIILGSLMGLVTATIIALITTNSIVKSVTKTRNAAIEIAKGNMDVKINISGSDEIGDLSRAIDKMRRNLKNAFQKLKENAKKLAVQLEKTENAQKTTSREKEKINTILQSIGDGVFVIDSNYKITIFNRVASKISGFTEKEVIGKRYDKVLRFVFEKNDKINDKFIEDVISTGEIKEMSNHTVLIRKDGKRIPVADSAAPFKDKKGQVSGIVVVFRDITREREVDNIKNEFISVASHQLRTPVSAINWLIESLMLSSKGLNEKQKSYLDNISVSTKRLTKLVDDLLDTSRIELGTLKTEKKELDAVKSVEKFIESIKNYAVSKKHTIVFNKKDIESQIIVIDPKTLYNVLQNLVSNAIDYSPPDTEVTIDLHKEENFIKISIANKGPIIPKKDQTKLFQKFYRAPSAKKMKTDGTGLGLYIVKSLVEKNGGKIGFKSEEGEDTVFWFTIPLKSFKKVEKT